VPGKMWLDIAMTSVMNLPGPFNPVYWSAKINHSLFYAPDGIQETGRKWLLCSYGATYWDSPPYNFLDARHGASWKSVYEWNDIGWICPNGKRPKKKWLLSYAGNPVETFGDPLTHPVGWACYWTFVEPCPDGVGITKFYSLPFVGPGDKTFSLLIPPFYCTPEPWPFGP